MRSSTVNRLRLRNYKSVQNCDLQFDGLTVLVGRNGAGKSNILDALRFVSDALNQTLEFAVRERGGIEEVRRRPKASRPSNFHIGLELGIGAAVARYQFVVAPVNPRGYRVARELCEIRQEGGGLRAKFDVAEGDVQTWSLSGPPPAAGMEHLYLVRVSGTPEFAPVFGALGRMVFHNFNPEVMKTPRKPESGDRLSRDGANLASVVKRLQESKSPAVDRVVLYLNALGVPVSRLSHRQIASFETLQFEQPVRGADRSWKFDASSISDGTLRAVGILVSLFSSQNGSSRGPSLVGIEEPETALHPAAAGALIEAIREASEWTQIVLTCHSADLLESLRPDEIRVVVNDDGVTRIAPIAPSKVALVERHLSSAGELLRLDQLSPDPEDLKRQDALPSLFEDLD